MKILTTAMAAMLVLSAHGALRAEGTDADKDVKHETKAMVKDEKALNVERSERNEAVGDLRADKAHKADAETNLEKNKLQGNEEGMEKNAKEIKHDEKAIAGDKKSLATEQKDVNQAKHKVRKTARRLHKAKAVQKAEDAK